MCKGPVAGRVRVVGGIGRMPGHWRTENKGETGKRRSKGEKGTVPGLAVHVS